MISISSEILGPRSPLPGVLGSVVRAVILSEDTPNSLTGLTGEDVDGLGDDDVIAVGSRLITPYGEYLAFSEGEFTKLGQTET